MGKIEDGWVRAVRGEVDVAASAGLPELRLR
jgi:hypothetical protein